MKDLLEKLAVLAPGFASWDSEMHELFGDRILWIKAGGITVSFGSYKNDHMMPEKLAKLFGAVCGHIDQKDWLWLKQANNLQIVDPDNDYRIIGDSRIDGDLTKAILLALIKALESTLPDCEDCENLQLGIKDEYKCKTCNGLGKQVKQVSSRHRPLYPKTINRI